jgi:hypothetical protein
LGEADVVVLPHRGGRTSTILGGEADFSTTQTGIYNIVIQLLISIILIKIGVQIG